MSVASQFSGGGIKSIQRGTVSVSSGSATATITAVNTAKTMLNFCGCTSGVMSANVGGTIIDGAAVLARIDLTSSTVVTASAPTSYGSISSIVVSYEVIEYF